MSIAQHNTLQVKSANYFHNWPYPFCYYSGVGQQRKQGVHGRGLRVELEEAESRAGRYPITEGFLQLLGALLSHGTPDNALGLGYRRPGLSVYLDYVIEDVLLKSHERTYRPMDWPSAQAQRWRITSLCLAILGTLLQNYPINAVPLEDPSRAALQSPLLAEVIADFREDAVEYNIEGFTTPQRCSRPKTAAFSVMHLLLGRSRLFEYMAFLLAECGAQSINNSFNEHCLSEVGAAVDLLQKQHSLAHPDARARADGSFDFALPLASNMGMGGFRASAAAAAAAKVAQAQPPLDLTALGRETFLGDSVFWQERTVAGVVGLIYECSLREGRFMSLYRAAPTKLSVTRTNDQGRITVAPVTCHDLSELLSADQDRGLLALIAQVVPMHVRSCPCLPAVNVLSVRILEHVALHLPASRLLAALIPPQAQQQRVFRDPSQPQPSFLLSEHHEAAGYLIEGCAAALRAEVDVAVEQNDGSLHYDVVCLGGEAYPYFYSLSSAYTRNTSPPNLYLTMINADSTEEAAQVDAEYIRALRLGGTIREAVLHLLLRTLTPNAACLSHQLLGLAPSVASVLAAGSGVRSDSTLANKMLAEGCLAAVLHVLSPHNMPLGTTFIQQSPEQAVDCFELVYRLCSSPLTSGIVLRRLSERHVDFFRAQITLVLYLMHLSDEELLEGADVTLFTSQQAAANGGSNSHSLLNPNFAVLQSIKTALSSCASWLLKACTLSLRHSELSRTSGAATHATLLLRLLYGSCTAMSFGEERGSRVSVLEKLLDFATDFPVHPYSSALPNPLMQQYLQAAGLEQTMAKAGTGWGDFNQFLRQDAVHAEVMTYTVVDLRLLSSLVKSRALQLPQSGLLQDSGISPEDLQTGLNIAVLLNMHAKHEAARNHLCASWCQLVNLSVASSATQLLLLHISDGNLSVPRSFDEYAARPSAQSPGTARDLAQLVFEQLFVPVSQVLLARSSRLHMQRSILPELFARCLMAQVRILTSVGASTGAASPLLLPDQHARMAESIVQLLLLHRDGVLSRPGDGGVMTTAQGAPSTAVSTAYRGLLASALEQILQVPIKLSNFTQSSSAAGASEEGKSNFQDSEADQEKKMAILAEYRSLNMVCSSTKTFSFEHSVFNPDGLSLLHQDAVERRVGELVDALGRDCAQQGPAVWRLCSITALSSVLSVFSNENSGAYGSHIFVQALQVLVQRGHLQAILAYVATITPYPSSASVANAADEKGQDSLFMSALTLCVHIAGSAEGAEALLACDVMQRLVAINHFVTPPPFPDEIAYFGAAAMLSREEAVAQLQSRYQMTIDLIRCLFASLPASHVIAAGAAEFLRKNQALVTQLLRMRYLSLGGLAMTEGTLAVLSMLAAVPRSPLTNGANKGNSTLEGTQALSALGSVADAFLVDISSLLGVIGKSYFLSFMSTAQVVWF